MKIRLFVITVCVFLLSVTFCFTFESVVYARNSISSLNTNRRIRNEDKFKNIISSGRLACQKDGKILQSKSKKKITICPVNTSKYRSLFYSASLKELLKLYFYKIRNLIYIICSIFLIFIWARIYWQRYPEWNLFYYVVIVSVLTTVISAIISWYVLYDDMYVYHCKKQNILWQVCKKGKGSFNALQKNLILLDANGKVLKTEFISDKFNSRYKVNMFY